LRFVISRGTQKMSIVHAKHFIQSIESDTELQAQVTQSNWDTGVILHEAASRNLSFTPDEFQMAVDHVYGVLSEEVLVNAVGGKNDDAGNDKHPNPPPGQDRTDPWSPPPGEVSGNSCLFGWRG